jgi:hypothetical protein
MNRFKILIIFCTYLFCSNVVLHSQDSLDINYDSLLVKSYIDNKSEKLSFHYSVLRYQSSADVIFLPVLSPRISELYELQILDKVTSSPIRNVVIGDSETTRVTNLQKDTDYVIRVYKRMSDGSQKVVETDTKIVSTKISEEFRASRTFYKGLSEWSSKPNQNQRLIDFIRGNSNRFNKYELAAFMQNHYKLGDLSDNFVGNITPFILNTDVTNGGTTTNDDGSRNKKCNCSLILNTYRDAKVINIVPTNVPDGVNYLALGDGAAKQMLMSTKGSHTSNKYEANIGGELSPLHAIISYNLICSDYVFDLPEECMCPKKILYDYSYTANLSTRAKTDRDWFPWSMGGEAAAEDYALLTIRNGGSVTAADAGRIRISSNCNSNWNVDWWNQAANVIISATGVAIDSNATIASWANLLPSVVTLFSTNFFNKSGDCTDKSEVNNLMTGSGELTLTTNNPVDILISSLGYEFVKGYGKFDSRATIVSDYHLATILLGQDINRPECCTPNVANFLIGNFDDLTVSHPLIPSLKIKVLDGSVNNDSSLKGKVNRLFTLWGPWPDLVRGTNGHYILEGDGGTFIRTFPNCAPVNPLQEGGLENRSINNEEEYSIFPNPVSDFINISQNKLRKISVFDNQGKKIIEKDVDPHLDLHDLNLSHLLNGHYFLIATDIDGKIWSNRFQKI